MVKQEPERDCLCGMGVEKLLGGYKDSRRGAKLCLVPPTLPTEEADKPVHPKAISTNLSLTRRDRKECSLILGRNILYLGIGKDTLLLSEEQKQRSLAPGRGRGNYHTKLA